MKTKKILYAVIFAVLYCVFYVFIFCAVHMYHTATADDKTYDSEIKSEVFVEEDYSRVPYAGVSQQLHEYLDEIKGEVQ